LAPAAPGTWRGAKAGQCGSCRCVLFRGHGPSGYSACQRQPPGHQLAVAPPCVAAGLAGQPIKQVPWVLLMMSGGGAIGCDGEGLSAVAGVLMGPGSAEVARLRASRGCPRPGRANLPGSTRGCQAVWPRSKGAWELAPNRSLCGPIPSGGLTALMRRHGSGGWTACERAQGSSLINLPGGLLPAGGPLPPRVPSWRGGEHYGFAAALAGSERGVLKVPV